MTHASTTAADAAADRDDAHPRTAGSGSGRRPAAEPRPRAAGAGSRAATATWTCSARIALVRVVVYHLFGWAWLTVLFPSMGVMFALAGSLMARSLNRPALERDPGPDAASAAPAVGVQRGGAGADVRGRLEPG